MNYDVFLVGVGGQGVLTIAELLATAAQARGIPFNYFPSKGMAQRGGFVKAQVRLGRGVVGPNIPERGADLVIALETSEALKAVRLVKPGGDFVLFSDIWAPTAVMLGNAPYPTIEQVKEQVIGSGARLITFAPRGLPQYEGLPVSDNMFVLGMALGHTRLGEVLAPNLVEKVVGERWRRHAERNLFGLRAGVAAEVEVRSADRSPEPVG